MQVPFLDLKAQYLSIKSEIDAAIAAVIDKTAFAGGMFVEKFEKEFAEYCGTQHAVAVSNGTSALELLMRAHGIGQGDEVITVANSFFASAEAISNVGATPVLVDCREDDALMDITLVEAAITKKTKALLPVHLYGQCADMDALNAIAKKHHLLVLEDACQAHGSRYKGRRAGLLGDGGAFSFYPGKNLGAYGEGGGVTTNDPEIAKHIRIVRDHGMPEKYVHAVVGRNERLDGIQGAILSVKLPHLDIWNSKRRAHAECYREKLGHIEGVIPMVVHADRESNYHLFVVRVLSRESVMAKLKEKGIGTGIHYPIPIHLQEAYKGVWKKGQFPISEKLALEILTLPMYAEMTNEMVDTVCTALKESIASA
ncbi:MAG: DegT/DnrJ/EryC1/StrS family aminotransferase [Candidatus Peribacteraceae bacterium]